MANSHASGVILSGNVGGISTGIGMGMGVGVDVDIDMSMSMSGPSSMGYGNSFASGSIPAMPMPMSMPMPMPMAQPYPAPPVQGQWNPPVPSMASLPVDRSKTEPKPAYYKLQFGDEVTGFSYYVRTLAVMIGRGCVSPLFLAGMDVVS
jgi:hypothetical protein